MDTELANLYGELEQMKQSAEVKKLKKILEKKINDKLRRNFLELMDLGAIVGYSQLKQQLVQAVGLVDQLEKKK